MFQLDDATFQESKDILKSLLRINTSNPPGNERPAVDLLQGILEKDGFDTMVLEPAPQRANLVSRLKGDGSEKPLLLSSHLDVVPADPSKWKHPPFDGVEAEGCIWGRGAIDMKGFAIMALMVYRLLKRNGVQLKRDIIFASVANEETDCTYGSAYLVDEHPELIRAEYVINEVGGFNIKLQGRRFYLVQVAERGIARLRITVQGEPGHSARPTPDTAMAKAAKILTKLSKARLPHHVSPPMREFLLAKAKYANPIEKLVLHGLTNPTIGPLLLHSVVPAGHVRNALKANLSNTVCPTIVNAGSAINVVPSEVVIQVDGRTSPSSNGNELLEEVRQLLGPEPKIELVHEETPAAFTSETPYFEAIRDVLKARDPEGEVLPYLVFGATDSRNYARLGSICYGFYPLQLPDDLDFSAMFHGHNERIPTDGFRFGIETLYDLVLKLAT